MSMASKTSLPSTPDEPQLRGSVAGLAREPTSAPLNGVRTALELINEEPGRAIKSASVR